MSSFFTDRKKLSRMKTRPHAILRMKTRPHAILLRASWILTYPHEKTRNDLKQPFKLNTDG